jgi:hypothetical protein
MHSLFNHSVLSTVWEAHPETRKPLEQWVERVKRGETLAEVLTHYSNTTFHTDDEKTGLFRFEGGLSLLARFHEDGTVEIKFVKYHRVTYFPNLEGL